MGVAECGVPRDLAGPLKKAQFGVVHRTGETVRAFLPNCSGIITCSVKVDGIRGLVER